MGEDWVYVLRLVMLGVRYDLLHGDFEVLDGVWYQWVGVVGYVVS